MPQVRHAAGPAPSASLHHSWGPTEPSLDGLGLGAVATAIESQERLRNIVAPTPKLLRMGMWRRRRRRMRPCTRPLSMSSVVAVIPLAALLIANVRSDTGRSRRRSDASTMLLKGGGKVFTLLEMLDYYSHPDRRLNPDQVKEHWGNCRRVLQAPGSPPYIPTSGQPTDLNKAWCAHGAQRQRGFVGRYPRRCREWRILR